jgi:hypothetical protein
MRGNAVKEGEYSDLLPCAGITLIRFTGIISAITPVLFGALEQVWG